jgi:hypothetical protein
MLKPKKHVVILGAGASITSGYPDANKLTVLMCDSLSFFNEFIARATAEGVEKPDRWLQASTVRQYYDSFKETVSLLKRGDFATMDELSNMVAGGQNSDQIQTLKKLMRFVFALNNPEISHWPQSDYRAFIQALFLRKNLLRDDISVISFNYDPYFEYRLLRALKARVQVSPVSSEIERRMCRAAISGYQYPTDLEWTQSPGFCHLKLHGTCILPSRAQTKINWPPQEGEPTDLISDRMFGFGIVPRFSCLSESRFAGQDPPILLPWEIVSDDGKLLEQTEFESRVGSNWQYKHLYPLFRALWQRARSEIQEADKISFVGISLSPFMEPELRFLFEGKRNIIQMVIANPENSRFKGYANPFHPNTFSGKFLDVLQKMCPNMACNRSDSEGGQTHGGGQSFGNSRRDFSEVTVRTDFADFIRNEM